MDEMLVLVDDENRVVGSAEKMWVHRQGWLHRAFSIFIFNSAGQLLLQQRAGGKYHSGGLWSNTCCGHPRAGERLETAAHRRLREEMGFDCRLRQAFCFVYREEVSESLVEHEFDHVYVGTFEGIPAPNAAEVQNWAWMSAQALDKEMRLRADRFTVWFRRIHGHAGQRGWSSR